MISIIVPIYNVACYLPRCLDSILQQTYKKWELLLIDDGSKDESGKICDDYAVKDERIRVVHTSNQGVSSARNKGLDEAIGEWIAFIDPDDWWSPCYLEIGHRVAIAENLEVIQYGRFSVYQDGKVVMERCYELPVMDGNQYVATRLHNVTVCCALIRRSVIESIPLRFQLGLRNGEDSLFMLLVLRHCTRIKHIADACYYYYRDNMQSAMHQITSRDYLAYSNAYVKLGNAWPAIKYWTDAQIMVAIFAMIANQDMPGSVVSDLFERAQITTALPAPYRGYVLMSVISSRLAFYYAHWGIVCKCWIRKLIFGKSYAQRIKNS